MNIAVVNNVVVDTPIYPLESTEIGDHDDDGVADLKVKFDKQELLSLLEAGEAEIVIVGQLADGTLLEGTGSLNVIHKFRKIEKKRNCHKGWSKVRKIHKHIHYKAHKRCHR